MAIINVNLEEEERQLHPEGPLLVRIVKSEVRDNKSGEGQHILWTLEPVSSENTAWVWLRTPLSKALFILRDFLKAARVERNPDGTFDTDECQGKELYVNIGIDEQYGNTVDRPFTAA